MSENKLTTKISPLRWVDGAVELIDQRLLPGELTYQHCTAVEEIAAAIRTLAVRGAPLIGIAAAYGMVLAATNAAKRSELYAAQQMLAATRPTAVNLFWALKRCESVIKAAATTLSMSQLHSLLLAEARAIHRQDAADCAEMAKYGADLLPFNTRILTHCNAGALATGGIGTALGVIRAAAAAGKITQVWVDETRPLLQGARLTAWEMQQDNIPYQLICDNMAASLMDAGKIDAVIVGADRIAANGDFANKIGTYGLAVLSHAHAIPFYVAAPWSTVDLSICSGSEIPVEYRAPEEVSQLAGKQIAPVGSKVWNPSFDVTPARLVTSIISERGVHFAGNLKLEG